MPEWGAARSDETAGCGRGHRNRRSNPWTRAAATSPRGRRRAPGTLTPAPPRAGPGRSAASPRGARPAPARGRGDEPEGAPARARNAAAGAPSGGAGPERRFSTRRKLAAVTRLLRGEPPATLTRHLTLTAPRLLASRHPPP